MKLLITSIPLLAAAFSYVLPMTRDRIIPKALDHPGELVTLAGSSVHAGFPSPAEDYIDRALDFNERLIENPAAVVAVKIAGESMTGVGMFEVGVAAINRVHRPDNGSVVLALVDVAFIIKRYREEGDQIMLQAGNPAYPNIEINDGSDFDIWGAVKHSISRR